jgi:Transposase DDE domain
MYFRKKTSGGRAYLQIVESRREGAHVRQQVIATLGRIEDLHASGQLERLLRSGARFAAKAIVVDAINDGTAIRADVRRLGPALVFERLWEETGCRALIEQLTGERKHGFALERAIFLTVLHRLFTGGSDRAADRWREDYRINGVEGLELHHLYRAMAWLGEELPAAEQDGRTLAPRCLKDVIEERLFERRRDLFTSRPVCTEMWPGNTADTGSLVPVVDRLRQRFSIGRVCIVADRGMISAETIAELEARGLLYILGVRERTDKLVRELVLDDPGPFVPLAITKRSKSVDYEAKAVALAGRRYIVCRNHEEAKKDAADRAAILAALERQLKKGDKALVGNGGYRRFLATTGENGFVIDRAKAEEDARFDGIFVLRTNTDLAPLDAMLCYKQLTMVEQAFRTAKSLFETRPIFHKLDETIRGHVSCSFLALVLKKALEDRIADLGRPGSWPEILADLDSLTETEVEQDNKRFMLRSAPRPAASLALRAVGVALPPTVRQVAET